MSYILDALRRADAERDRGTVPTLHAQPAAADLADLRGGAPAGPRRWFWWSLAGLLAIVAVVVVALLVLRSGRSAEAPHREPVAVTLPPPAAVTVPAVVPAAPPALAPLMQPAPVSVEAKRPAPLPAPKAEPAPAPAPAAPATPAARVAEPRLPTAAELPEALRRELPPVVAGGAMYSDTPASRMLILNGQVFREGDQVAPQLVLEQIKLKGAVLVFKGQRYSISY